MEIRYKINSHILLLAMLGATMICSSYLIFTYNPLQMIVKKMTAFTPDTFFFKFWSAPPIEMLIDVYIFNVTNPEEFLNGEEKLRVNEIGPYIYQEILTNANGTLNDNGTLTFYPRRALKFRRDLSIGDPDVDTVISPNIPLLGITSSLQEASFLTNMAVSAIASSLGAKQFLNLTISEYLWGYDDRLVTLANKAVPSWINFEKFGILDRLMALDNASNVVTLNLRPELNLSSQYLSPEERSRKNHIHRWNGSPGLKHWGYIEPEENETIHTNGRCNMVEGAFDGTIFPLDLEVNSTIFVYRRAFCRPFPFTYVNKTKSRDGFDSFLVKIKENFLATPEENPDNACYCIKGRCLPKGLGTLAPCYYDIPIVISQPHFFNADPLLLDQVEGMVPNETLHDSAALIHSQLGVPLEATLSVQINLDVGQTRYNSKTKPFNGLVLPLFWLQVRVEGPTAGIKMMLTFAYHMVPVIHKVLIYLLGIVGLALMSGSALVLLFYSSEQPNGRLSFRGEYSPIPIIPNQYFKPEIRICK